MKDQGYHLSNREHLTMLFRSGTIEIERGDLFDRHPGAIESSDFDRIEGMMLGLAIGDALGNTSESQIPAERRATYGEIRDYLPNRHAGGARMGLPSDDSQLAFWTLEQLLADNGLVLPSLAGRFARGRIFGIGRTVRAFLQNYHSGMPWHRCGVASSGNGSLMRIAPVVVPYFRKPSSDLWVDTSLCAMLTHNDAGSISACLAFVSMLWKLLAMHSPPVPEWWLKSYVEVATEVEGDRHYRPRGGEFTDYEGPLWRFVAERVGDAYEKGLSVLDACNRWHSGAYLIETVPCVVYILMRHGHDPEEAIVRAVNDTRDNDTIAAIVGAAVGALHGRGVIPARWTANLLGRTAEDDDGRVFDLLEQARRRWSSSADEFGGERRQ